MTRRPILPALALALSIATAAPAAEPRITEADADKAARSVAKFCKILITRMETLIDDQWATQDLQDLAAVWDSLDCHRIFGIDERIRWLLQ